MKNNNNKIPILIVHQRILHKKNSFECSFEDGLAKTFYSNEKVAQRTYENMKNSKQNVKLEGNTVFHYLEDKTAKQIFNMYLNDVKKGISAQRFGMSIKYELKY